MGPALVPIVTAVFSAAASTAISSAMAPDAPEQVQPESLEPQPAAIQTIDPGKAKEAELLKQKDKRKKQGFLESFGETDNTSTANFGLL